MWQSFKFQAERDDEIESVSSCWTPPVFQAALSTRKFKKKKILSDCLVLRELTTSEKE